MSLVGAGPDIGNVGDFFHVYIIESTVTAKWYYGASSNLSTRLEHHNKGWNRSTKGRGPWRLIFDAPFDSWVEARKLEVQLKAMRNKSRIKNKFKEFFLSDAGLPLIK